MEKRNILSLLFVLLATIFCGVGCNNSEMTNDEVEEDIVDEVSLYRNNSLPTGTSPYADYYGQNRNCGDPYCSRISVKAPYDCDVVVIVKEGNEYGSVVANAYISRGDRYTFSLGDGTFQTFFYMGSGWNPNKQMNKGISGGFVENESFSKDNPQLLNSCELSYELIQQVNGNFSTKRSNEDEIF